MTLLKITDTGMIRPAQPDEIFAEGRRLANAAVPKGESFTSSSVVADFLVARLSGLSRETLVAVLLDSQNRVISVHEIGAGTISRCQVYIRELARVALEGAAAGMVLAHNHPSGAVTPSKSDIKMTQDVRDVLSALDVRLLDHFVIGGGQAASMADAGVI